MSTVHAHPGRRRLVRLLLSVKRDVELEDIDAYIDQCWADLESRAVLHAPRGSQTYAAPDSAVERQIGMRPPRRADYPLGEAGSIAYRHTRGLWYEAKTGRPLVGALAKQKTLFFNATRDYRARLDREIDREISIPVSYTHLTLPTKRIV